MSLWSKLFGSSAAQKDEGVVYEGFKITPVPMREGSEHRVSAKIEKEVDGELCHHHLIRADTLTSADAAAEASIAKAKQLIDQVGVGLFR